MIRNGLRTRPKGVKSTASGTAIDADLVRALAQLISDSDLAEMEIEKGDLRIKLVRHTAAAYAPPQHAAPAIVVGAPPAPGAVFGASAEAPVPDHAGAVKSPMVGTLYRRASPESKSFV